LEEQHPFFAKINPNHRTFKKHKIEIYKKQPNINDDLAYIIIFKY